MAHYYYDTFFSVIKFEIVETRKLFRQNDNNKIITSVI